MKFKTIFNGAILFIGLDLAAYSQLNKVDEQSQSTVVPVTSEREFERWNLLPGSVYEGDTLRVVRGNEELKIRFCGIDAPEKPMPMSIEFRDYLRSLIELENGELLLVPIEQDKYGCSVAEVYTRNRKDSAMSLNLEMVRAGYALHYAQYSDSCPIRDELIMAEEMAKKEGGGILSDNPQPPGEWRSFI